MASRTLLSILALTLAACTPKAPSEQATMTVVRIVPDVDPDRPTVFLNQPFRVDFSRTLDRLSVTKDTVRLLDEGGRVVPGRLKIGTRSVTIEPDPPLSADFQDGALKPGHSYRIEVAGFPRANAVRDDADRVLDRTFTRHFRTLPLDLSGSGLTSHLLPVSQVGTAFRLRQERPLRIAADLGTLQIPFTLPLLPSSVSVQSFKLFSGRDGSEVLVAGARVVSRPDTEDPHPGCTVELDLLDRGNLQPEDVLFLVMRGGEYAVRDYSGRAVEPLLASGGILQVVVDPGSVRRVVYEPFLEPDSAVFQDLNGKTPHLAGGPGFLTRAGRASPRVYREAGSGLLGDFRPTQSMTLVVGNSFVRGDGLVVTPGRGLLEFRSLHVPAGVELRIEGTFGESPRVLVAGDLLVDGDLVLVASPARRLPDLAVAGFSDLESRAGAMVVCGGELRVRGRVRNAGTDGEGTVVLVAGAGVQWSAPWEPSVKLAAVEPSRVVAPPECKPCTTRLRTGVPESSRLKVESATRWYPVGRQYMSTVDCRTEDVQGQVDVFVQIASPDPLDPTQPDRTPAALSPPFLIPPGMPLHVPPGGFVRFLLVAEVGPDQPLPSVAGITLFDR